MVINKLSIRKYLYNNRHYLLGALVLGLIVDVFVLNVMSEFVVLFLLALWLVYAANYQIRFRSYLLWAFGFLLLVPLLAIFAPSVMAEKVAIWAYTFLVVTFFKKLVS